MYRNSYSGRGKRPRYNNSISRLSRVSRSSARDRKSTVGLKVARVVVGLLIVALVVGMVIFGSAMYKVDSPDRASAKVENSAPSNDAELLRVVNKSTPLDKDYVPNLEEVNGVKVNTLAVEPLKKLLSDAEGQGIKLYIDSAYIPYDAQGKLFNQLLKKLMKERGLSEVKAQAKCEAVVPQAGRSEAQTGLLISFKTDGAFENSKAERWLSENCIFYGFVRRYAKDKESVTSMKANPKAYRYVGAQTAEIMRSLNKSLDEYSVYIKSR